MIEQSYSNKGKMALFFIYDGPISRAHNFHVFMPTYSNSFSRFPFKTNNRHWQSVELNIGSFDTE